MSGDCTQILLLLHTFTLTPHTNLFNHLDLLHWLCLLQKALQVVSKLPDSILSSIHREGR